jgi:hypothetical protein
MNFRPTIFSLYLAPRSHGIYPPLILLLDLTDAKKRRKKMPLLGEAPALGAILILLARSAPVFTEHFNQLVFLKFDATLKFAP